MPPWSIHRGGVGVAAILNPCFANETINYMHLGVPPPSWLHGRRSLRLFCVFAFLGTAALCLVFYLPSFGLGAAMLSARRGWHALPCAAVMGASWFLRFFGVPRKHPPVLKVESGSLPVLKAGGGALPAAIGMARAVKSTKGRCALRKHPPPPTRH